VVTHRPLAVVEILHVRDRIAEDSAAAAGRWVDKPCVVAGEPIYRVPFGRPVRIADARFRLSARTVLSGETSRTSANRRWPAVQELKTVGGN
jgi:hypothetical protein